MENLYDILGVPKDCTPAEIRAAYKRQAGKCHPDKNQDDPEATVRFQTLQTAYDILKDPQMRERYDETGATDEIPALDESASDVISKIYVGLMERNNFESINYVLQSLKEVQNSLRGCIVDKTKFQVIATKMEYILEQTTINVMVREKLDVQLAKIRHKLAHAEKGEAVLTRAIEILEIAKYTGDIQQAVHWAHTTKTDPYIA